MSHMGHRIIHILHNTYIKYYITTSELEVTVYCTSYELLLAYKLRVTFIARVAIYFLTMSYDKGKVDKDVMIIMLW